MTDQQSSAVAVAPTPKVPTLSDQLGTTRLATRQDVERIETDLTLPRSFQYVIDKWVHDDKTNRAMKVVGKVGVTAEGYEYINRVLGATTFLPKYIHDETGKPQLNPIHHGDYTYGRMGIVFYNPMGQLVSVTEDFEVDFLRIYHDIRANSKGAEVIIKDGEVQFDKDGNPLLKISAADEMKAIKELTRMRRFGPRYGQTIARVRLLKIATGIRALPASQAGHDTMIRVVGWRDKMTPQDRIAQATQTEASLYGGDEDETPILSTAEMGEAMETEDEVEVIEAAERESVEQSGEPLAQSHPDAEPPE